MTNEEASKQVARRSRSARRAAGEPALQMQPVVQLVLTDTEAVELADILNQARQCGAFRSAEQQGLAQEIEEQIEAELRQGQLDL